jgi:hypothetical protein
MWKFLPGVSKPKSKRKVDTHESNKAYDATKKEYNVFKWLHFDGEIQLMSCDSHSDR